MPNIRRVSAPEAKDLLDREGYVLLDVRSEPEYEAGHPAGAQNVPFLHSGPSGMQPNPDFMSIVEALYPKSAKLLIGCRSGGRSMRAAEMMQAAGYTDLIDLRPGYDGARDPFGAVIEPGWAPSGLPTETSTPGSSYAELKQKAGR